MTEDLGVIRGMRRGGQVSSDMTGDMTEDMTEDMTGDMTKDLRAMGRRLDSERPYGCLTGLPESVSSGTLWVSART